MLSPKKTTRTTRTQATFLITSWEPTTNPSAAVTGLRIHTRRTMGSRNLCSALVMSRLTAFPGCMVRNLYRGARKGRSCSSAPASNMIRPSPSKDAICIVGESATFSAHRMNHSARLDEMQTDLDLKRISKPTQTSVSLPQVLCQDNGTPTTAHSTKKSRSPDRYPGPRDSNRQSSATSMCYDVDVCPERYCSNRPMAPATRDQQ